MKNISVRDEDIVNNIYREHEYRENIYNISNTLESI